MSLFLKTIFQIKVLVPILIITTTTAGVIYYNQVINNDNETDNQTKTNQSDSNKETKTKTKTYTLTYISGSNGTISGNLTQTVKEGEDGEVVTAIPDTGYHFTSWSDNNSTTASRTDTNIRQDITTTARFEKEEESITQAGIPVTKTIATTTNPVAKSYTLTYTAGTNGSITGTNPQTIEYGSDGSAVTAAPDAGYHFTSWSDGVLTATRTDTNITANLSVTASFVINTYDITPSASVGGTISPDSIQTVEYGDDKTFSFTSNTGYHIDDVLVDGISHGNITNYTFSNIQDNHTISVTFEIATVTIGTQNWMQYNLNLGTRIDGATAQTNNSVLEKWCYDNLESNCTTYGGLYQWDEMMQYVTTEGVQGICPTGFHLPTDTEYSTLSTFLGGLSVAGDKMKSTGSCQGRTPCGTSGFNALLGGLNYGGSWYALGSYGLFWSSSQDNASYAWARALYLTESQVDRYYGAKTAGFSVRCLKN